VGDGKIAGRAISIRKSLLCILFFASGATSLAYEVLWTKVLTLLLGTTAIAVSAVVCSVMGGVPQGA
jgi:Kef-type K+ transport system membrane component KefB